MTLDTIVRFKRPTNARQLHDWANQNLLKVRNPRMSSDDTSYSNEPGQGFPAWIITTHNNGKPFAFELSFAEDSDYYAKYPEEKESERASFDAEPVGYVDISFDTAYGYQDDRGRGCTELHAWYIAKIAAYASELGVNTAWKNEYTGKWHDGVEGLDEFASNGAEASEWFKTVALPAIVSRVLA